jgi:hypothetical protein
MAGGFPAEGFGEAGEAGRSGAPSPAGFRALLAGIGRRLTARAAGPADLLDWGLVLAAGAAVVGCYALYLARVEELMQADTASAILVGREMIRQGTILLEDYYHSTEVYLLGTPLIVALWFPVADSLLGAFRLAVVTEIALQSACLLYMMRRLGASPKAAVFALLAFFGPRSYDGAGVCGLGGAFYGTAYMASFLFIGYYASSLHGTRDGAEKALRLALPVLAFTFGVTSARLVATVIVPLLLAHSSLKLWTRNSWYWEDDRILREIMLWLLASAAGRIVTVAVIVPRGFGPYLLERVNATGIEEMAIESLPALFSDFGLHDIVFWALAPFESCSVAGAVGILCLTFYSICAFGLRRRADPSTLGRDLARWAVIRFFVLSLAMTVFIAVLKFPVFLMNMRYLFLIYALLAMTAGLVYGDLACRRSFLARAFLSLSCGLFIMNSILNVHDLPHHAAVNPSRIVARHSDEIVDAMAARGVRRAYALYWDSAVTTVLSEGRAEVYGVRGDMEPSRWIVPLSAYSAELAGDAVAFLRVLQETDPRFPDSLIYKVRDTAVFDLATGKEVIPDPEGDIVIYFFDRNPFAESS